MQPYVGGLPAEGMSDSDEVMLDLVLGGLDGLSAGVLAGNDIGKFWWAQANSSLSKIYSVLYYYQVKVLL